MKKEFKLIMNTFENDVLKKKTILYFKTEEELKKKFNIFLISFINNKYNIDIYNKMNHFQAFYKNEKIEITTSTLPD